MISVKAYAKINLSLDLVGKREDGYHLLRSVMQEVSLCDYITLSRGSEGITLRCNKRYIPTDERNIAYRTAKAFFDYTGITPSVKIYIKKYIPCGAGLGGGSSDGAAVVDGLCRLYGVNLTAEQKAGICESIGADIPFFFYGGTSLIEGIGEKVTPVENLPDCRIVIVKPKVSLSTAAIFGSPLTKEAFGGNSTDSVIAGINSGNLYRVFEKAENALEGASCDACSVIADIKRKFIEQGALFSMMSGSGSAVYGVFKNYSGAKKSHNEMKKQFDDTYICKPQFRD